MALCTMQIDDSDNLILCDLISRKQVAKFTKPAIIRECVRKAGIKGDAKLDLYYGDEVRVIISDGDYANMLDKASKP